MSTMPSAISFRSLRSTKPDSTVQGSVPNPARQISFKSRGHRPKAGPLAISFTPMAAAIAAGLFSMSPDFAWAANINVGVGQCTLANAIGNANSDTDGDGASGCVAGSGADVIVLPASSTQTLRAALPDISSEITIEGNGATLKRRKFNPELFRILSVTAGGNLTLNNTTVTGGFPAAGDFPTGAGGGISNVGGVLTLNGCTVSGNTASDGGGVLNIRGGTATVNRSTVSRNRANFGGGLYNGFTTLALIDSTVSNNDAGDFFGGGMWASGDVTVTRSRITDNHASGGGGVFIQTNGGSLSITRSEVSGNRSNFGGALMMRGAVTIAGSTIAENQGDGVLNLEGTLTLTNSTVSGNGGVGVGGFGPVTTLSNCTISGNRGGGVNGGSSDAVTTLTNCTVSGNSSAYGGGGIRNPGASLTLINTTVSGNRAPVGGGVYHGNGTTTLVRSLISGNSAVAGPELSRNYGTVVADSHNLFGSYGSAGFLGFTPGATDIVPDVSPLAILNPLARNGGRTRTQALVTGSPAIDAAGTDCPPRDQRGVARPVGAACDIGAYEGDEPPADLPTLSIRDASVVEGTSDGKRGTRLNFTVSLSGVHRQDVYGGVATSDGTATSGLDYRAEEFAFFVIPAGSKRTRVTVFVKADAVAEAAETLNVTLLPDTVVGATIADGEAIGTIIDDD